VVRSSAASDVYKRQDLIFQALMMILLVHMDWDEFQMT
jgi:hypothetical protein